MTYLSPMPRWRLPDEGYHNTGGDYKHWRNWKQGTGSVVGGLLKADSICCRCGYSALQQQSFASFLPSMTSRVHMPFFPMYGEVSKKKTVSRKYKPP